MPDKTKNLPDSTKNPATPAENLLATQRDILGVNVLFEDNGPKIEVKNEGGSQNLRVNAKKFPTQKEALRKGIMEAAYIAALKSVFAESENESQVMKLLSEKKTVAKKTLNLRGLNSLKLWNEELAQEVADISFEHLTSTAQFDFACEQYILTGKMPEDLSEKIREAIEKLPTKDGVNVLNFIAQEKRVLKSAAELYEKYVVPLRAEAAKIDSELKKTEREDYVPPPFKGEMEPMDPESAEFKVYPPVYGYYRGRVYRYDPKLKRIVAQTTNKSTWTPQNFPEDMEDAETIKKHTYAGTYTPGKENILPMPYKAFPLPGTLKPAGKFVLMRDENGTFSLEPKTKTQGPAKFEFVFLMSETEDNKINDEPLPGDTEKFTGPLDENSKKALEKIRGNTFLSELDQSRSITSFTRSRFIYPENEQMPEMDARYKAAGSDFMIEMDSHKIANCHWSNINASQLNRELDIPSRVPTGFFVKPVQGADFAAVGGIGHAWLEVWDKTSDPENPKWKYMDATPNKKDQKDEDGEKQDHGEVDMDDLDPDELTKEALEKLIEDMLTVQTTQTEIADALFTARTKVSPEKWRKVLDFIKQVNSIKVKTEDQIPETPEMKRMYGDRIKAPKGTMEREWEKLFALICEHRIIKKRAFRGPVPQSEGVRLKDPVTAAIDVLSGSSDPHGFEVEVVKTKTQIDVKEFEEDVVVDLTASMDTMDDFGNVMKAEQKKLILFMLYNEMKLNKQLNDSRVMSALRTPVQIKSEVFSIRGTGDAKGIWSILKTGKEAITEQLLTQLADELDKTTAGEGDLVSALRAYRLSITPETQKRLQNGELIKMLTVYSDGNVYCTACGRENHDYEIHEVSLKAALDEVNALREMGVIVQGIGFTEKAAPLKVICEDKKDPDSAVIADDVSKAIFPRQRMIAKHLKKL